MSSMTCASDVINVIMLLPVDFELMSSFLDMEMRYGDAQYSHTLCEGLIDTHPEQIEIYWIYIELLSKENAESAR